MVLSQLEDCGQTDANRCHKPTIGGRVYHPCTVIVVTFYLWAYRTISVCSDSFLQFGRLAALFFGDSDHFILRGLEGFDQKTTQHIHNTRVTPAFFSISGGISGGFLMQLLARGYVDAQSLWQGEMEMAVLLLFQQAGRPQLHRSLCKDCPFVYAVTK